MHQDEDDHVTGLVVMECDGLETRLSIWSAEESFLFLLFCAFVSEIYDMIRLNDSERTYLNGPLNYVRETHSVVVV